jgi:hypothetical protein
MTVIDTDALARAIVAKLPRVPLDKLLWDKAECAAYLKQSVRTFERTLTLPDFPAPVFTPVRCWRASEVIEWGWYRRTT